jgi:hypothetical protein
METTMRSKIRLLAIALALATAPAASALAQDAQAPAAAPATTPSPAPATSKMRVALVVTDELRSSKWGEKSWGGKGVNNLSDAVVSHSTAMLSDMGADVRPATATDKIDGVQYYVTPVIKRAEQSIGMFAWSKDRYTLALEWRVTDDKGSTVLLDTVVGEATGTGGNAFTAHDHAIKIFKDLMDDTFTKSRTLLTPVLVHPAGAAS